MSLKWIIEQFGRALEPNERIVGKTITNDVKTIAQEWGQRLNEANCVVKLIAMAERKLKHEHKRLAPYITITLKGTQKILINYNRRRDGSVLFDFEIADKALVETFGELGHCWIQTMELEFRKPSFDKNLGVILKNSEITPGTEADTQARLRFPNQEFYRCLEVDRLYDPITGARYDIFEYSLLGDLQRFTDDMIRPVVQKRLEDDRIVDIKYLERFW